MFQKYWHKIRTIDAAPEDLLEANGVEKDGITRNKEEAVNDNLPTAFHIDHKGNYLLLKIKSLINQIF